MRGEWASGVWDGVSPFQWELVWGGAMHNTQKKIIDFRLKMVHSGAFVQAYIAAGNF